MSAHRKSVHVMLWNSFTREAFKGNPAGVVPNAVGLSDDEMQLIAHEIGAPETAFVLPSRKADVKIRWFSPTMEIPLCGHATVAAFSALAHHKQHGFGRVGRRAVKIETKSGILGVWVEYNAVRARVTLELPLPKFTAVREVPTALYKALGISKSDLDHEIPVVRNSHFYLPVKRRSTLWKLNPDFTALAAVSKKLRVIGISVYTRNTIEKTSAIHSRFFAPSHGINEDAVTGTANGPLGMLYWLYNSHMSQDAKRDAEVQYFNEQGDVLGRAGRVGVTLSIRKGKVKRISITGEAVCVVDGEMSL